MPHPEELLLEGAKEALDAPLEEAAMHPLTRICQRFSRSRSSPLANIPRAAEHLARWASRVGVPSTDRARRFSTALIAICGDDDSATRPPVVRLVTHSESKFSAARLFLHHFAAAGLVLALLQVLNCEVDLVIRKKTA